MAVNWGLGLNYPDAGQAFTEGLRSGASSSALNALLADPNNPAIAQKLAPFNPELALKIQGQQQNALASQYERDVRVRAAQGDPNARTELAGIDWDAWSKLDEGTRKQAVQAIDFIGQAALDIDRLPEQQRASRWAEYVRQAEARGMDIPAEYEVYSPGVLSAALAESKQIKEALAAREPKYQVIPEGGMLVNTRDPAALAQVGAGGAPQPAQGGVSEDQAAPIIQNAMQSKIISPEDFARIQQSLGPNGQQAAQQWLQSQGIQIGKQIGGKTYVQRGGDWYEVN